MKRRVGNSLGIALVAGLLGWAGLGPRVSAAVEGTNAPGRLTIDRIFVAGEFNPEAVGPFRWLKHRSGYVTFEAGTVGRDLVRYDPDSDAREVLVPGHAFIPPGGNRPLSLEDYTFSEDGSRLLIFTEGRRVWRTNARGDYWVMDLSSRELKRLGGDAPPSSLMYASFSPDGRKVAFVRANNLYVQDLGDLRVTALTTNGSASLINGTFDWVYEEELFLRRGYRWSPDSRALAYWQLDTSGVPEFHLINNTDGMYPRLTTFQYPKTGERNAAARVGWVPAAGGETRWLAVPGDPREHYLARMDWLGDAIALQQFNRPQNTNRVFLAEPGTGQVRLLWAETDAAWVENENEFRWTADERSLIWLSERDGWRHAYRISRSGRKVRPLTRGEFDVMQLELVDREGGWLYFMASPEVPTQQYLYRVRLKGGAMERLTPAAQPGNHSYQLSPDGRFAFHTYSTLTQPPVVSLVRLPEHTVVKALTDNAKLREKLDGLPACATELFRVEIGDGVALDGWCIRPPQFDPGKRWPVLFHVYGEPAGQTVLDRWGTGGMWHRLLAEEGYLVVSVDNRGTPAPRGRAWRKCVYRQVGILASADQAAALRALAQQWSYLDTNRVAIWGWSGGGSMTLNAILRYPELYQTGMAVAAVPNQRLYDTIYQERYMGLPADNPEGYRNGSPLTYAHQLKGNLLLVHGTADDNVHYQGVEALINELVAYNKPFTMMAYPNRSHGIHEGPNTTRHLYELLTRFLKTHTPPGPREP